MQNTTTTSSARFLLPSSTPLFSGKSTCARTGEELLCRTSCTSPQCAIRPVLCAVGVLALDCDTGTHQQRSHALNGFVCVHQHIVETGRGAATLFFAPTSPSLALSPFFSLTFRNTSREQHQHATANSRQRSFFPCSYGKLLGYLVRESFGQHGRPQRTDSVIVQPACLPCPH